MGRALLGFSALALVAILLALTARPKPAWSVYIHAHADDWQGFSLPKAQDDHGIAERNLLIVLTTAGDASRTDGWWQAREEASRQSVRRMIGPGQPEEKGTLKVGSRSIAYWQYGRPPVVMAYMRLPNPRMPDPIEADCPTTAPSLCMLRDGVVTSLTAVDGSATYASWEDFSTTLRRIVSAWVPDEPGHHIHAPDTDRTRQTARPGSLWCTDARGCPDHPDHLATGDAVVAMVKGTRWSVMGFVDYPICRADTRYPINLSDASYRRKKILFMAYDESLVAQGFQAEYPGLEPFWENCFRRQYYRTP